MALPIEDHGSIYPIRIYNRIEPRPRSTAFDRALRAEIHDPLWMLTRQWQFGELQGEDTGSAITAVVHCAANPISHGPQGQAHDLRVPLEAQIEALETIWDLRQRVRVGQAWRKWMHGLGLVDEAMLWADLAANFSLPASPPPELPATPELSAAWAFAVGRGAFDGQAFVEALRQCNGAVTALFSAAPSNPDNILELDRAGREFLAWVDGLQLPAASRWRPEQLAYATDYGVRTGPTTTEVLHASAYDGRLASHSFDADTRVNHPLRLTTPGGPVVTERIDRVCLVSTIRFPGMPAARWWELEDGRVNLARVETGPEHLAHMLLTEFALTYSNDWFMIPLSLPLGHVARIESLVVTDVFGQRTTVERAGAHAPATWNRFDLFGLAATRGDVPLETTRPGLLLLAPARAQQSEAIEEVVWIRDEMGNLAWAIEETVMDGLGGGTSGARAGQWRRATAAVGSTSGAATGTAYGYLLRPEDQPEHWIPFVPLAAAGSTRMRLQRARLKRWVLGQHLGDITPMTRTLGAHELTTPMFVDDAELPRAGVRLSRCYQRARTRSGGVIVWLSYQRSVGRGEGSAAVRFDQLLGPTQQI